MSDIDCDVCSPDAHESCREVRHRRCQSHREALRKSPTPCNGCPFRACRDCPHKGGG